LEVFLDEVVHRLLFLLDFVHFRGNFVQFFVVLIESVLHSDQQERAQVTREQTFDTLIHEFKHDLQRLIYLLADIKQRLLVTIVK